MGSATAYTYQGGWNNGQWANKHEYDVWGFNTKAPTYNYDPMYRATEPYYTGHPYDGSLNIYFAENRFYDAETGTWLSQDPIKDGLNWYVYCEGNPTTFVDVLGLDAMVVNGNLIEDIVQNSDGSYSYNADELARLVTNPNFTNNSLTTLERAMLYDSLKNTQSEYVKRDYFGKMMCQTFDSQRYIEWYDVAANVNVPQNSKWGKAVLLMDNYLKKDKSLFEGMSIFFFEGLGDYSGGRNRFHPEGQYGAMSIVIDNGKITFVTQEASTLPDQYVANTRNCVVDPGIYSLNYVRHAGLIHGFNVVGNNNDKVLVKTFSVNNAQGYHIEQCAAINVHSVAIPFNDNSNNSEGCITLSKTEYVKFGFYTGLFDNEVFDIYVNFKSEYLYSDIKKFSSEDENTMQQLLQDVQLIVNREHMLKSAMLFSSKHSN